MREEFINMRHDRVELWYLILKREPDDAFAQLLDRKQQGDGCKRQLTSATRRLQRQRSEPEEDGTCGETRGGREAHLGYSHDTTVAGSAETMALCPAPETILGTLIAAAPVR